IREIRKMPFCYLCGGAFQPDERTNPDHVPPTALFALVDRDFPLILPTHRQCNADRSAEDQVVGQLVGLIHRKAPNRQHNKLRIRIGRFTTGAPAVAVEGFDLRWIVRRWVRAFHAALYGEFLPESAKFLTSSPLPEAEPPAESAKIVPVQDAVLEFAKELKRNRATATLDRIVCRNGKCRYECVWAQADNGAWMCIYGLDVYGWIHLGDGRSFEPRGCVGSYRRPEGGVPPGATSATR